MKRKNVFQAMRSIAAIALLAIAALALFGCSGKKEPSVGSGNNNTMGGNDNTSSRNNSGGTVDTSTPEGYLASFGLKIADVRPAGSNNATLSDNTVSFWFNEKSLDATKNPDFYINLFNAAKAAADDGKVYNTIAMHGNQNEAGLTAADIKNPSLIAQYSYKYKGRNVAITLSLIEDWDSSDNLTACFTVRLR